MRRARFDSYIRRFNAEDDTAFDEFLRPDMTMLNGSLRFSGIDGMKHHYRGLVWPHFVERLTVLRYVSNTAHAAVEMWTRFSARHAAETLFGPVVEGELFDYRGLIFYDIREGRFATITVAYNSFVNTKPDGTTRDMGMPH
jgi:hypothetical protein